MTPAEMREALVEESRWWASQEIPRREEARGWISFFEQLPEDDHMLVLLSGA